jgi:hypothetical protein
MIVKDGNGKVLVVGIIDVTIWGLKKIRELIESSDSSKKD